MIKHLRPSRFPWVAAVLLGGLLAASNSTPAAAHSDVAAAVAAGLVGVAVGAALSDNSHHHSHSNHFSPQPGVTCYDRQRACYHDNGGFAAHATREYYR